MALCDKLKQMLTLQKKKECLTEKQDAHSQDAWPTNDDQRGETKSDRQMRVAQLTPREKDLYLLLLEGFTLKESAKQLAIKYSTVNTHMTSIYRKLEVKSRPELIINYHGLKGGNYDESTKR